MTPLKLATRYGQEDIETSLRDKGAKETVDTPRKIFVVGEVDPPWAKRTSTTLMGNIICPFTDEFRHLATLVPSNSLVLEIGCSYGKCTEILAHSTSPEQVVGMDISKEAIKEAEEAYPNLKFIKSDALRDPMSTISVHQELCNRNPNKSDLVVFVDIGGNRELESLVALLPWIEKQLNPISVVVKSETLTSAVRELCDGEFNWELLQRQANEALQKRKITSVEIVDMKETEAKAAPPTVKIKTLHPLKAPLRKNQQGTPICRFHNYDPRGCRKYIDSCTGETCPFDHEHCHICLKEGHIAMECNLGKPLI